MGKLYLIIEITDEGERYVGIVTFRFGMNKNGILGGFERSLCSDPPRFIDPWFRDAKV